jgi:hypothetical protein
MWRTALLKRLQLFIRNVNILQKAVLRGRGGDGLRWKKSVVVKSVAVIDRRHYHHHHHYRPTSTKSLLLLLYWLIP